MPGLDLAWARAPDVGLPRPDLCLLLDVSMDEAMRRAEGGGGGGGSAGSGGSAGDPADAGSSNTITSSADNSTKTTVSQESAPAHERYETAAMQARVRELFTELRSGNTDAKKHVDETDDIVVVDASASLDEVEKDILERVLRRFEDVDASGDDGGAPLRRVRAW